MFVASAGQYGVDLFFVLSGWLIGGLYWKEYGIFPNVDILRFWLRRWLRTIPPYFVALFLSWFAVRWQRNEPFDWGYLLFIQNYYSRLPFFLVSWSLCIEEHFYLFFPLLLYFPSRRPGTMTAFFAGLILIAPVSRWWYSLDDWNPAFGFEQMATHLRMEGLLAGFWLAKIRHENAFGWKLAKRAAPWAMVFGALVVGAVQVAGDLWMQRIGLTALPLGLAGVLVCLVERNPGSIVSSPCVKAIAQSSYSVYLTNPLLIHTARLILEMFPTVPWQAYFPLVLGLIVLGGGAFYFAVERASILLRDKWVPRRCK